MPEADEIRTIVAIGGGFSMEPDNPLLGQCVLGLARARAQRGLTRRPAFAVRAYKLSNGLRVLDYLVAACGGREENARPARDTDGRRHLARDGDT
ncbi:MAG: hypothetical protein HYX54_02050 [Chloroflexi bacterium]|nr:hypothetical protein [Chloroflexota bacterium]